jgi:protein Tex
LRLDDELGAKPDRVAKGAPRGSDRPATSSAARKAPQPDNSGGGALAEALRRAAEKNGSSKTRPR